MVEIYCHDLHGTRSGLCDECAGLLADVRDRVERCPFGGEKPTCLRCTVHCFKPSLRERVRQVMRHAGPRMPLRHPLLALMHFVDGKRPVPAERKRRAPPSPPQPGEREGEG